MTRFEFTLLGRQNAGYGFRASDQKAALGYQTWPSDRYDECHLAFGWVLKNKIAMKVNGTWAVIFSSTLGVRRLASSYMKDPVTVFVGSLDLASSVYLSALLSKPKTFLIEF